MNPQRPIATCVLMMLLLAGVSPPAAAEPPSQDRFVLTLKRAIFDPADESQPLHGNTWHFDDSVTSFYAVEGETLRAFDSNFSIGGEVLRYINRFGQATTGDLFDEKMRLWAVFVKSKYHFRPGAVWQPYVGGGIGKAYASDYHGPIDGTADGYAAQAVAGMEWGFRKIGVRAEYMYLHARLHDDNSERVDASGRALTLGLAIHF